MRVDEAVKPSFAQGAGPGRVQMDNDALGCLQPGPDDADTRLALGQNPLLIADESRPLVDQHHAAARRADIVRRVAGEHAGLRSDEFSFLDAIDH
ncbi:hypothetical protein D3C71_1514010 [compost metagenome]